MPFREWNCCAERFRRMLFQPKSPGSCLLDPVRFLRRVRAWPAAAVICMKCRVHEGIRPGGRPPERSGLEVAHGAKQRWYRERTAFRPLRTEGFFVFLAKDCQNPEES